jgi:hypothetical protein
MGATTDNPRTTARNSVQTTPASLAASHNQVKPFPESLAIIPDLREETVGVFVMEAFYTRSLREFTGGLRPVAAT